MYPPFLLFAVLLAAAASAQPTRTDERRVRELERQFVEAAIKKTVAPFERLAAPEFAQISLDGHFQTKAEIIEHWPWRRNANVFDRTDRVIFYNAAAIVTGQHDVKDGGSVAFTRVWHKRKGQWLAIASSHSFSSAFDRERNLPVTGGTLRDPTVMEFAEPLTSDAQEVFQAYRVFHEAFYGGDRVTIDRLTTGDCLFGKFGTFQAKQQLTQTIEASLAPDLETDVRVRAFGNAAVVTGRRVLKPVTPSELSFGFADVSMAMAVFVKRGNGWLLASAHETRTLQR